MQQTTTRKIWGILIPIIVLALGLSACTGTSTTASGATQTGTGMVTTLTTTSTVEASGSVEASQQVSLLWKTTGQVGEVLVRAGDTVRAGDVLMRLVTTSAPANVISAQADLINAQNTLDDLLAPSAQQIAAAEKTLADAHSTLDKARSDLKSELNKTRSAVDNDTYNTVADAETALKDAQDALPLATADAAVQAYYRAARAAEMASRDYQDAQDNADEHPDSRDLAQVVTQTNTAYTAALEEKRLLAGAVDDDTADLVDDLVAAQADYDTAVADYLAALDGTNAYEYSITLSAVYARYATAQESLDRAQSDYYQILTAPIADDVAVAQARQEAAQATLSSLWITAPFDGEVLVVNYLPGDMVASDKVAVVLADRYPVKVKAQVDESDIGGVLLGSMASITLDVLPGQVLRGTVTYINPIGQTVAGVVKYSVEITLADTSSTLLLGATADVTIQTSEPTASLAVPVNAVQSDASGEFVNKVLTDGSAVRISVVSGEMQGDLVLVSGDLRAGDVVALVQNASSTSSLNPFSMGR
jgi:HlyD family secretion protein